MKTIKTGEFRTNLKRYLDSAFNNKPIVVAGEQGREVVLISYKNYLSLKNKAMKNEEKINWYNDYLINESINEAVKDIIGTYTRLDINNPKHPNNKDWDVECNKWIEYKHTLSDMFIATEKEALEVKSKLQSEVLRLYKLENSLLQKQPVIAKL